MTPDALLQAIEAAPKAGRTELALAPEALAFAASLPELDRTRLKQRLKSAGVIVSDWLRSVEAIVRARRAQGAADAPDWQRELTRGEDGRPLATARNCGLILRNWEALESLRLNRLTLEAELDGKPLTEGGYFRLREEIEGKFRVVVSSELIQDGIAAVAEDRTYHPVRDYLDGLPAWDGVRRLNRVHELVLLAPPEPLYGRMLEAWFVSAVARIYDPGCQVDTCLCLFSEAGGKKKTTFFRVASKGYWNGGHVDPSEKDSVLVAHQSWVKLLDEVDDLTKRSEWSALKRWMTDPTDTFRPPYGRRPARFPRAFVFGATTNKQEFLPADSAAARRFWTIPVGNTQDAQIELLESRIDLLWSEARHLYLAATDNGTKRAAPSSYLYWFRPEEEARALDLAGHHQTDPVWLDKIEAWLASPMRGTHEDVWRTEEILEGAMKLDKPDTHTKTAKDNVGEAMRRLGYVLKNHTYDDGQKKAWKKL